jgi:hypothetical protein
MCPEKLAKLEEWMLDVTETCCYLSEFGPDLAIHSDLVWCSVVRALQSFATFRAEETSSSIERRAWTVAEDCYSAWSEQMRAMERVDRRGRVVRPREPAICAGAGCSSLGFGLFYPL